MTIEDRRVKHDLNLLTRRTRKHLASDLRRRHSDRRELHLDRLP